MRYALTDRERNNIQPTCRASHAAFRAAQRANVKTLDRARAGQTIFAAKLMVYLSILQR